MLWSLKGSLPWVTLVTPAAALASSWTIDNEVGLLLLEITTQLRSGLYPLLSALYIKPDGTLKKAGDTVQQPVLASTLLKIAKLGPDYLYSTMASTIATGKGTKEIRAGNIQRQRGRKFVKLIAIKQNEAIFSVVIDLIRWNEINCQIWKSTSVLSDDYY
jgi:Gamma-glutamyltranspeptidase